MKAGYKKTKKAPSIAKAYAGDMPEFKPTISIDEELLSDVKNWKINSEHSIEIKVKLTGLHKKYDSEKICADFEILSAETDKD